MRLRLIRARAASGTKGWRRRRRRLAVGACQSREASTVWGAGGGEREGAFGFRFKNQKSCVRDLRERGGDERVCEGGPLVCVRRDRGVVVVAAWAERESEPKEGAAAAATARRRRGGCGSGRRPRHARAKGARARAPGPDSSHTHAHTSRKLFPRSIEEAAAAPQALPRLEKKRPRPVSAHQTHPRFARRLCPSPPAPLSIPKRPQTRH